MANPQTASKEAAWALAPGVSYFQVFEPPKILDPNGAGQYAMFGPFLDIVSATNFSNSRPGSLVTVTLVLHQVATAAAAPLTK